MVSSHTARLAVVDLDWMFIRAVDIYAVLQSFVSGRGELLDVTVYRSRFGERAMAEEAEHGPKLGSKRLQVQPRPAEMRRACIVEMHRRCCSAAGQRGHAETFGLCFRSKAKAVMMLVRMMERTKQM